MAHIARCSNSMGKWQGFPKIKGNGVMPIGVLKVLLYAHNASSNFCDQSFVDMFTVFSNMFFISQFEISVYPFDCE